MKNSARSTARMLSVAARMLIAFTLIAGVGYTLLITGVGQVIFPAQANGSLVEDAQGRTVGSELIGQPFLDSNGEPLIEYFQPRPSAAGDGWDGRSSGGTNQGPESAELIAAITERQLAIAELNGVSVDEIPADAVTASASGLDPHISPEYALLQAERVAEARGLTVDDVLTLIAEATEARSLGFLGEPRVNVLMLNLSLDTRDAAE